MTSCTSFDADANGLVTVDEILTSVNNALNGCPAAPYLYAVAATDALTAWAVGDDGKILHTTDGGGTWFPQYSSVSSILNGVTFINDALNGWAVGNAGVILHTADGGAHWETQSSNTQGDIYAVGFVDAKHGWAVGDNGLILATTNGGDPWTQQSSPGVTGALFAISAVSTDASICGR